MRKKIRFIAGETTVPYEVVKYLEALGVNVWPMSHVVWLEDGTRQMGLLVEEKQYKWAAGLIEGYGGFKVIEPENIKPIRPKTRWNTQPRKARGFIASIFRPIGFLMGTEAKLPPKRRN